MLATLYAISIIAMTIYGGNLLWLAIRHARRDTLRSGPVPEPDALPTAPHSSKPLLPPVTVQIPIYNEPLVVERVIDACARLNYPRELLEIQVLDDSTDATVELAEKRVAYWRRRGIDIVHIRRDHRDGYKAGALQNGLRLLKGDFVAVFDADFLPQADFLLRMIPEFTTDDTGMVQARWGHLNQGTSLITRLQAMGLDAHFAVEQQVRNREGCFINFNGTAGVWRRTCIEDAGGWQGDTIAEDLDLSYRAQMQGWIFKYLQDFEVPAELPSSVGALRSQQFRWTKGSIEAARKLLWMLIRSGAARRAKIQGALHLTAHLVFPCILIAALVHAPLLMTSAGGGGPGELYFGLMSVGLVGFAGFVLAQLLGQRELYPDWGRRIVRFPLYMAGTIGLSIHNSRAVLEALLGKSTSFVRTPKLNQVSDGAPFSSSVSSRIPSSSASSRIPSSSASASASASASSTSSSSGGPKSGDHRLPVITWLELALFIYSLGGLAAIVLAGEWAAVLFQTVFAAGFGMVVLASLADRLRLPRGRPA